MMWNKKENVIIQSDCILILYGIIGARTELIVQTFNYRQIYYIIQIIVRLSEYYDN